MQPLQCSCPENPRDGGAWWAAVYGVTQSQTWLKWLSSSSSCMKWSLGISNFLEEISNLSHSIVFLYFFAVITELGFLFSPCCSLELCIQMGISLLFSFAFCFSSFHSYFALLHLFFLGMVLIPVPIQCHQPLSIVHQALCLSDLIPWIYWSPPLCNHRDLIEVIPEWPNGFPYFLQMKPEFCNKELMIWATVNSRSCFCWLYGASPSLTQRT